MRYSLAPSYTLWSVMLAGKAISRPLLSLALQARGSAYKRLPGVHRLQYSAKARCMQDRALRQGDSVQQDATQVLLAKGTR